MLAGFFYVAGAVMLAIGVFAGATGFRDGAPAEHMFYSGAMILIAIALMGIGQVIAAVIRTARASERTASAMEEILARAKDRSG